MYTKKRCIIRVEYSSGTGRYLQVNKFQKNAVYLSRAVMAHAKTVNIIKPTDYERFNNLYAFSHTGTGRRGRCVVMHDAPSFLFITDINRFIFFKLR